MAERKDKLVIGWIGLGFMGEPMSNLLAKHLHSLSGPSFHVFNRTQSKTDAFIRQHPYVVGESSPQTLATECHITFSSLANDDALLAVLTQYLDSIPVEDPHNAPRLFVDTSTVLPATIRHSVALATEHNVTFLHCPVFGRPDAAAAGSLRAVLAGGSSEDRARVAQLAEVTFAQKGIVNLGDEASAASAMKLLGNCFIVGQIELASECLALAAKAKLPTRATLDLMQYIVGGPIPGGYARRIAAGDFGASNGFTVDLGLKDVSHIQAFAREVAVPLPVADVAAQHLLSAKARHGGHLDWGAIGLAVKDAAGVPATSEHEHDTIGDNK